MTAVDNALRLATEAGVAVTVDGADLVLEYNAPPPADVLAALKAAKSAIVGELRLRQALDRQRREEVERREITRWINNHFISSPPGCCTHCGGGPRANDRFVIVVVGNDRGEMHVSCHPVWLAEREAEARKALGINP
jgi:hypothetical protein